MGEKNVKAYPGVSQLVAEQILAFVPPWSQPPLCGLQMILVNRYPGTDLSTTAVAAAQRHHKKERQIRRMVKMCWGFGLTLLERYSPISWAGKSLEDIYNYLPVTPDISTSGQPTREQFRAIRAAGFKTVINLLPENIENAMPGEKDWVESLGLTYIHIPVRPWAPTQEDFDTFSRHLESLAGEKVWLHCAANARVSAFLFRYRCEVLGEDPQVVKWDVRKIWEPFGVWKKITAWPG